MRYEKNSFKKRPCGKKRPCSYNLQKNSAVSTKITTNVQIDKSQDKLSKKRQIELDSSGSSSDSDSDTSAIFYFLRKFLTKA